MKIRFLLWERSFKSEKILSMYAFSFQNLLTLYSHTIPRKINKVHSWLSYMNASSFVHGFKPFVRFRIWYSNLVFWSVYHKTFKIRYEKSIFLYLLMNSTIFTNTCFISFRSTIWTGSTNCCLLLSSKLLCI